MILSSCANCCFNPLQYGAVGTPVGYCTEHRLILNTSSELTCGRHLRKDLMLSSAERENQQHAQCFSADRVALLRTGESANGGYVRTRVADLDGLRSDPVASAVTEYGLLGTKIESLAQLRVIPGARAEIAMLSLGRSYVRRCVQRGGAWTSGIHLAWWTGRRLAEEPVLSVDDIRTEAPLPLNRRIDLAKWSIVVLRLVFVSDVALHARQAGHRFGRLANLAEEAAEETSALSARRLLAWASRKGRARFDAVLPESGYIRISQHIREQSAACGS